MDSSNMNIDCLPNLIENLKDYTPTVCPVAIPVRFSFLLLDSKWSHKLLAGTSGLRTKGPYLVWDCLSGLLLIFHYRTTMVSVSAQRFLADIISDAKNTKSMAVSQVYWEWVRSDGSIVIQPSPNGPSNKSNNCFQHKRFYKWKLSGRWGIASRRPCSDV